MCCIDHGNTHPEYNMDPIKHIQNVSSLVLSWSSRIKILGKVMRKLQKFYALTTIPEFK